LSDLVRQGTDIRATTIHHLFDRRAVRNSIDSISEFSDLLSRGFALFIQPLDFDGEFTTRLDFTKIDQDKVRKILELQLLMWDEVPSRGSRMCSCVLLHSSPCPYGLRIRWTLPETGLSPTVQDGPWKHARQHKHGGQQQKHACFAGGLRRAKVSMIDTTCWTKVGAGHTLHVNSQAKPSRFVAVV